jgi:hypothetical protein
MILHNEIAKTNPLISPSFRPRHGSDDIRKMKKQSHSRQRHRQKPRIDDLQKQTHLIEANQGLFPNDRRWDKVVGPGPGGGST